MCQNNPELVNLVVAPNSQVPRSMCEKESVESTQEGSKALWRKYAVEMYYKRLLTMDLVQLKQEAKLAQMRCQYFSQIDTDVAYPKKVTLGSSKTDLVKTLTQEAYYFLLTEDVLYHIPDSFTLEKRSPVSSKKMKTSVSSNYSSSSDMSDDTADELTEFNRKNRVGPAYGANAVNQNYERDSDSDQSSLICLSDSDDDSVSDTHVSQASNGGRETVCAPRFSRMSIGAVRRLCFGFNDFRPGQR